MLFLWANTSLHVQSQIVMVRKFLLIPRYCNWRAGIEGGVFIFVKVLGAGETFWGWGASNGERMLLLE